MRYLDANVFIRYFAQDEPDMALAARELLRNIASGKEQVGVLEATVAEVVYVLGSPRLYGLERSDISERLQAVLEPRSFQMANKGQCVHALRLYEAYGFLDFPDALLSVAALNEGPFEVYSFDRDFDRVPGITRLEPASA